LQLALEAYSQRLSQAMTSRVCELHDRAQADFGAAQRQQQRTGKVLASVESLDEALQNSRRKLDQLDAKYLAKRRSERQSATRPTLNALEKKGAAAPELSPQEDLMAGLDLSDMTEAESDPEAPQSEDR
jgi:hypothetical protein